LTSTPRLAQRRRSTRVWFSTDSLDAQCGHAEITVDATADAARHQAWLEPVRWRIDSYAGECEGGQDEPPPWLTSARRAAHFPTYQLVRSVVTADRLALTAVDEQQDHRHEQHDEDEPWHA
jgi:hypothetical protein